MRFFGLLRLYIIGNLFEAGSFDAVESDGELEAVKRSQRGDRAAFSGIYEKYKRAIYCYICGLCGNKEMADELAQATFVSAFESIRSYKPTGSFSSWLYGVARNVVRNEFRRLKRSRKVSLEAPVGESGEITLADIIKSAAPGPEDLARSAELAEKVKAVLGKLPEKHREVIVLCLMENMPYEDAAKILRCSKTAVANRLYRARIYFIDKFKKSEKKDGK